MYEVIIDESFELYEEKEDIKLTFETYEEAVDFCKVIVEQYHDVKISKVVTNTL